MSDLLTRLRDWRGFRAIVVGDVMLDELVYGDAERLTADAPVPVLQSRRAERMPGGAANVCMNLVALHAGVALLGVVGDDGEGRELRALLEDGGIDTTGLLADPGRPTTVKRSFIGLAQHRHPQKMFRVDVETREPIGEGLRARLLERLDALLPTTDVVAIEDYDKGVCTPDLCREIIARCRRAGVEVLVDPAMLDDYARYAGATAITPNRNEAERAGGVSLESSADAAGAGALAESLLTSVGADAIVLTLDRHGALLAEKGTDAVSIPTVARQVYDVTGAGDMVLAALVGARANRIGWPDATRFANAAAGLEVEIFGVKPIPLERIHQSLLHEQRAIVGKLRTLDEAAVEIAAARREARSVVFTNGCFDLLHAGHIHLLRHAAGMGDLLVVAINSDDSVRRLKGENRPIHDQSDRVAILSELESVDIVVVFDEDTPTTLLERLRPDVLVKGGDYEKERVVGWELVESYGGRIEIVPTLSGRSTTSAVERIKEGSAP